MVTQHTAADRIINQMTIKTSLGDFTVSVEVNATRTKRAMIDAVVFFGNGDEAGWRLKDDSQSLNRLTGKFEGVADKRKQVKIEVAEKLGISYDNVRGQALYSSIRPCGDGMAKTSNGYVHL